MFCDTLLILADILYAKFVGVMAISKKKCLAVRQFFTRSAVAVWQFEQKNFKWFENFCNNSLNDVTISAERWYLSHTIYCCYHSCKKCWYSSSQILCVTMKSWIFNSWVCVCEIFSVLCISQMQDLLMHFLSFKMFHVIKWSILHQFRLKTFETNIVDNRQQNFKLIWWCIKLLLSS
jgi:hypothetical protein